MQVRHWRESLEIREKISQGLPTTDAERWQYRQWVHGDSHYVITWDYFKHPTSAPSTGWLVQGSKKKMLSFLESADDSFQDWLARVLYLFLFEAFGFYSCGVWLEWISQRNLREIEGVKIKDVYSQRSYLDDRLLEFKVQELVQEPVIVDAVQSGTTEQH